MPFIKVVPYQEASAELRDIYQDLIAKRGKLAAVHQIQSLNPESIIRHMELYMTVMFGKSPLPRAYREMLAVVVSAANDCPYCISHHAEALIHFWKDNGKVDKLIEDYREADLNRRELVLCEFAHELTLNPSKIREYSHISSLKQAGWDDRAILDASLIISYFNFVNRIVLGLGVNLESEGAGGYRYD